MFSYGLFDQNYRVAPLLTIYLTVSGFIIPSLNSIGQFSHAEINETKIPTSFMFKIDTLTRRFGMVCEWERHLKCEEIEIFAKKNMLYVCHYTNIPRKFSFLEM